jgi:hypothetical protein
MHKEGADMDMATNEQATTDEIVDHAQRQGVNLDGFRNGTIFQSVERWIFFWRKRASLPASGKPNEPEGTLKYNMQGAIRLLPHQFKESSTAFRGVWTEAGRLESLEQAFELLKAWLLDGKEVDELPTRTTKRCGI